MIHPLFSFACATRRSRCQLASRIGQRTTGFLRIFLGLICTFWLADGAALRASQPPRFMQVSVDQGLSQSTVQVILQDHVGFIWFGTEEGLNRYDGYSFAVFRHDPKDPRSLPGDLISALHEDRNQQLWVGTAEGLCQLDRKTETFTTVPGISGRVTGIAEDSDGTLWATVESGGVFQRRPDTGVFVAAPAIVSNTPSVAPTCVLLDRHGALWIGTFETGIEVREKNGKVRHFRHDPANPNSLAFDEIWGLAEDKQGSIWVATYGGGLSVYDPATDSFRNFHHEAGNPASLGTDLTTTVFVDRDGTVWIGTDGAGLQRYNFSTERFIGYQHDPRDSSSLSQDVVRAIYQDRQGQIWVGAYLGGANVLKIQRHPFDYYTHSGADSTSLSEPTVASFLEDSQGTIWIGMEHSWLNRFDPVTGNFEHYHFPSDTPGGAALLSMLQDRRGRIWIGSYRGGLARFDPPTSKFSLIRSDPVDPTRPHGEEIWAMAENRDGRLWLGTEEGVDLFDPDTARVIAHYDLTPRGVPADVRALLCDDAGNLWVGSIGGLHVLRAGASEFTSYHHDDNNRRSLSHDSVVALHLDRQGRLWVGTYGGGINLFDTKTGAFTPYKDFPSNVVYRIEQDAAGLLWVSTNHGLARFDPATGKVDGFDLTNGLQTLQFHQGASLLRREGRLLFGGTDGFYDFDPAAIKPDGYAPPVVLTAIRRFAAPGNVPAAISSLDQIELSHQDQVFSIEFAALDYTYPRRNHYAYLMEGFTDRWLDLGVKREVTFTNLDAGTYVFRVKASNSDGAWHDESMATLRIIVRPAVWGTWWFRGLCAAGLGLIGFGVHRMRVRLLTADIAERKRAELALRQAEEKYRELVEDIEDIIFAADESGRVTYISPVVETALGYTPAEIVGHSITKLIAPEELAVILENLTGPNTDRLDALEHRVVTKNGQIRWMRNSVRPIFQGQRVCGLRGVLTDVTERKKLEEQLRQSQKMEAIGQLAGGVAHDFNNLLTGILSYSELLLDDPTLNADASSSLMEIRNAGQRAAALTRQLLAFSRRQLLQPRIIGLNELVADMEKMLKRLIGEDVHLIISLPPDVGQIKADPSQIEQIILNLAINARDAMPRGGKLIIETSNVTLDEHYARQNVGVQPGNYIRLTVSDTGCGMDPEVQAHLFEPFFTTKGVGKGTGLGLSTVYGIVKQSNGHVAVYSEVGVGTTFKIYLPRTEAANIESDEPRASSNTPFSSSGTVLLVEDNESVRKIARHILIQSGFTVVEATTGEEALRIEIESEVPLRLLLTDVIMPGMNGRELAEQLTRRHPGMKVLFMSGYTDDAILRHGGLGTGTLLLEKPFTPDALTRRVREVLES